MADLPESAVELAARAMHLADWPSMDWNVMSEPTRNNYRKMARAALPAIREAVVGEYAKDAARYRWLRNPEHEVGLVLDKVTGHVPYDPGTHTGGYSTYEYRAGEELDAAIDAALTEQEARHDER